MSRRYYKLPPLTSLATFETAARHRSFKGAAEELGVTPNSSAAPLKLRWRAAVSNVANEVSGGNL